MERPLGTPLESAEGGHQSLSNPPIREPFGESIGGCGGCRVWRGWCGGSGCASAESFATPMERAASISSSDEESSSGEEELAQLMPLRIIDARIIGTEMGPEEKFRLCGAFGCAPAYLPSLGLVPATQILHRGHHIARLARAPAPLPRVHGGAQRHPGDAGLPEPRQPAQAAAGPRQGDAEANAQRTG